MSQYLGDISAYALAVSQGYTGTEEEYAELMASYATVGQTAVTAAQTATTKASEAATSATTATNKASEATTAATTATTKAAEASTSASTATSAKDTAVSASQTATSKATEATTAAATAVSAKDDAVSANTAAQSAKTAAQTAQTGAETAAASVQSSAAQIQTNADDISELKEDLGIETYNLVSGIISKNTINSSGLIIAANDYDLCLAPVENGKTYSVRTDDSIFVCGFFTSLPASGSVSYDNSRVVQSGMTIVAPTNGFIAFRVLHGYATPQINEGATLKEYLPHLISNDIVARQGIESLSKRTETVETELASYAPFKRFDLYTSGIISQLGYRNDAGDFVANNAYVTYDIAINTDCQCYFDSTSNYYSICRYSDSPIGASTFISPRLRFNNSDEDTAPKENSKLSLSAGQYISITFSTRSDNGFYLNDWSYYAELKDNVYLGSSQLDQVKSVKNYAVFHGSGDGEGVYLYFKTSCGKLRYNFAHANRPAINADTWRIDSLYAVDDDLTERFAATTSGEWECAIRLANRPDFSGGIMHGDEITSTLVFLFDGVPYTAQEVSAKGSFYFEKLKIVELSNLYDSLDNTTLIATHQKEYTFNDDGITINQNLTWAVTDELSACYMAMLPASKVYTDMFYTDVDYTPVIAENNYGDHANVKKITLYSDDHGFICSLEVKKYPTGYQGSDLMNIRDNNSDYNKVYFNVCESGQITSGTKWESEAVYKFCVGEPQ